MGMGRRRGGMSMKKISLDNGLTVIDYNDLQWKIDDSDDTNCGIIDDNNVYLDTDGQSGWIPWGVIWEAMDDELRDRLQREKTPCTVPDFVWFYLDEAKEDLIIG